MKLPGMMPPGCIELFGMLVPKARTVSLLATELPGLSISIAGISAILLLLSRRCRFDDVVEFLEREEAPGPGTAFSGAAAMGTTPLPPTTVDVEWPKGVLPVVFAPEAACVLTGLSLSLALPARAADEGVVTCGMGVLVLVLLALLLLLLMLFVTALMADIDRLEFLREATVEPALFFALELAPPMGRLAPDPLFLFLMTSVFKLRGRTTPCNLRNKPHALHSGWPSGFRLHNGVVWVKQFVHVVGPFPSFWFPEAAPCRLVVELETDIGGDDGRLGATEENPDIVPGASPGEFGSDWAICSKPLYFPDI